MTEYETQERDIFMADLARAETGTREEKREAYNSLLNDIREDPKFVIDRLGWMLNGSYGSGAYKAVWDVINNPRMNREAWLFRWFAALEYLCPDRLARKVWNELTPDQQKEINRLIGEEIEYYRKEMAG